MSVSDSQIMLVVVGLLILRLGMPVFGIWLIGEGLKRAARVAPGTT